MHETSLTHLVYIPHQLRSQVYENGGSRRVHVFHEKLDRPWRTYLHSPVSSQSIFYQVLLNSSPPLPHYFYAIRTNQETLGSANVCRRWNHSRIARPLTALLRLRSSIDSVYALCSYGFLLAWYAGTYMLGCLEIKEEPRCEHVNIDGVRLQKCFCSQNLCNSSNCPRLVHSLLLLVCLSITYRQLFR